MYISKKKLVLKVDSMVRHHWALTECILREVPTWTCHCDFLGTYLKQHQQHQSIRHGFEEEQHLGPGQPIPATEPLTFSAHVL